MAFLNSINIPWKISEPIIDIPNAKKIDEAVWNILLRGPTVFSPEEAAAKLDSPDKVILSAIPWDLVCSAELRSAG